MSSPACLLRMLWECSAQVSLQKKTYHLAGSTEIINKQSITEIREFYLNHTEDIAQETAS